MRILLGAKQLNPLACFLSLERERGRGGGERERENWAVWGGANVKGLTAGRKFSVATAIACVYLRYTLRKDREMSGNS